MIWNSHFQKFLCKNIIRCTCFANSRFSRFIRISGIFLDLKLSYGLNYPPINGAYKQNCAVSYKNLNNFYLSQVEAYFFFVNNIWIFTFDGNFRRQQSHRSHYIYICFLPRAGTLWNEILTKTLLIWRKMALCDKRWRSSQKLIQHLLNVDYTKKTARSFKTCLIQKKIVSLTPLCGFFEKCTF